MSEADKSSSVEPLTPKFDSQTVTPRGSERFSLRSLIRPLTMGTFLAVVIPTIALYATAFTQGELPSQLLQDSVVTNLLKFQAVTGFLLGVAAGFSRPRR